MSELNVEDAATIVEALVKLRNERDAARAERDEARAAARQLRAEVDLWRREAY